MRERFRAETRKAGGGIEMGEREDRDGRESFKPGGERERGNRRSGCGGGAGREDSWGW